jgi:hypothetical protein
MEQYHYAARVYGTICVKQPLTAEQVEKFVQLRGETGDTEIFFVRGGCFIAPYCEPGVIFVEDPQCRSGQLFIKLKGNKTFWAMHRTDLSNCRKSAATLLKYADILAEQLLSSDPITAHEASRKIALELAAMMGIKDPRLIDIRQTEFIKLERDYGPNIPAVAASA